MKIFSILFLLIISISSFSQIETGIRTREGKKQNFTQTQLISLRNKTCVFVVPEKLTQTFEEILPSTWTFCKYEITNESVNATTDRIVFKIAVEQGSTAQTPIISMQLSMLDYNNNPLNIANIALYPKADLLKELQSISDLDSQLQKIYLHPSFYNMNTKSLRNNLTAINNLLATGKSLWLDNDYCNSSLIKLLKNNELSIPEYCFLKRNMLTGEDEEVESETLLKKYPFTWTKESSSQNERFVLMYAQSGSSIYLSVFDKQGGQVIYHQHKLNYFKLKSVCFKDIANLIS